MLGVYGLLGWKPDAMWILIGLGILATTVADAAFAVQQARGVADREPLRLRLDHRRRRSSPTPRGCATPGAHDDDQRVTGMRAIALALIAQALAIGIQIYAFFEEVGRSERVVTVVVLVVASVQIILTRPRAGPVAEADPPRPGWPTADGRPASPPDRPVAEPAA